MSPPATSSAMTLAPTWCPFQDLPSDAEAAIVASRCLFSLATLAVAFSLDSTKFALVERECLNRWRWAIYSCEDLALDEGRSHTAAQARHAAERALHRRSH